MKKVGAVLGAFALAGLVAACDQGPSVFAPDELNIGVASPGTAVNATLTIVSDGVITYRTVPRNAGTGTCTGNGVFTPNPPGVGSTAENQVQCTDITDGSEVVVTFVLAANYVQPKSGNIHLNFSVCGYMEVPVLDENDVPVLDENDEPVLQWVEDPCTEPASIHFQKNKNFTQGNGKLYGRGSDDQQWEVNLGQIGHSTSVLGLQGIDPSKKKYLLVANVVGEEADDDHVATLDWNN
jgi:hypothetical protein